MPEYRRIAPVSCWGATLDPSFSACPNESRSTSTTPLLYTWVEMHSVPAIRWDPNLDQNYGRYMKGRCLTYWLAMTLAIPSPRCIV